MKEAEEATKGGVDIQGDLLESGSGHFRRVRNICNSYVNNVAMVVVNVEIEAVASVKREGR